MHDRAMMNLMACSLQYGYPNPDKKLQYADENQA